MSLTFLVCMDFRDLKEQWKSVYRIKIFTNVLKRFQFQKVEEILIYTLCRKL